MSDPTSLNERYRGRMTVAAALAFVIATSASTTASGDDHETQEGGREPPATRISEARPGLANEAAALPLRYHGYVSALGGAAPSALGPGAGAVIEANALFAFTRMFAVSGGAQSLPPEAGPRTVSPTAALFMQVLTQGEHALDLTVSARYRGIGPELAGGQLSGRVAVGRAFGRVYATLNGMVGTGIGDRDDIDADGGALVYVRVLDVLRFGAEGRVRGELVDRYDTAEDHGRPVEVVAGGTAGVTIDRVLLQALGGVAWPRGPLAPGPTALASATFSF